ncbi:recombinase family protein [Cryobacterium algoricola]|nr:recombinase family protein [Cryobacterium algoricola]
MRPRIGAYARISLDAAGEALGVARQHKALRRMALKNDWEIVANYTDNNLSAFKRNVVRPEFERLLRDLESGLIDGFITYDLDRLARQQSDLDRVIKLYDAKPSLVFSSVTGISNLNTPTGILIANIMVTVANNSSRVGSDRGKFQELQRAEMGKPKKGPRPFGYAADQMTLDPTEGPIVRRMGMEFLSGSSYGEIADALHSANINMRSGKRWYAEGIQILLTRPRNGGLRDFRGQIYKGTWTPIFTPNEWESIQHAVKRRRERFGIVPVYRKYVLTGYLLCGKCGSYLSGMTKRDSKDRPLRTTYQCASSTASYRHQGCGGVCVGSGSLEHFIREAICYRLDTEGVSSMISAAAQETTGVQALILERDRLLARRVSIREDYADGTLSKSDFVSARDRIDGHITRIDRELDAHHRSSFKLGLHAGESVREAWNTRPLGWRRALIDTLIDSITINGSRKLPIYDLDGEKVRFDPNRVDISWKV